MAAAMHAPSTSDAQLPPLALQDSFSRRLTITDFDLQDNRYPSLSSSSKHRSPIPSTSFSSNPASYTDRPVADTSTSGAARDSWVEYTATAGRQSAYSEAWVAAKRSEEPNGQPLPSSPHGSGAILQAQGFNTSLVADGSGSYLTPAGSSTNPPFTSSPDRTSPRDDYYDNQPQAQSSREQYRQSLEAEKALQSPEMGQRLSQHRDNQYRFSSPRHPSLPAAGVGASPSSPGNSPSPIVPMSAGPSYTPAVAAAAMAIPISPKPRAFAQQPTYINQSSANPSYAPPQVPREEVCVECAMRDQDMADVDVTGPGVWERESDAMYEDLVRREALEEQTGLPPPSEGPPRPRAKGNRLSEENLKLWMTNPKEPSSRQQTLDQYVKSQRSLLEAEALAHARAMRESRMLDDKMRDAYAQLRRSAYELGSTSQPPDDGSGVRIKVPRSASTPIAPPHGHGREVTLLQNGMIVEHVDVRKEERERKRDEKRERSRVRKSSRSSRGADVMSVYSLNMPAPTDSGFFSGMRSESRYSQSVSQRPTSVMTAGNERPATLLRAQSQASFSDMQSIGSTASPRRSRFFGFKNLSTGFRSQDSLAPTGSMVDMHLALHREQQYLQLANANHDTVDIGSNAPTLRLADGYQAPIPQAEATEVQATKKRKGLLKFWKFVTGQMDKRDTASTKRSNSRSLDRTEDDAPLAPPPPLSYLVNQGSRRHLSTPSLPSAASPHTLSPYATSPPTAPSSIIPSPTSSRRSTGDNGERKNSEPSVAEVDEQQSGIPESSYMDSDPRGRATQASWTMPSNTGASSPMSSSSRPKSTIGRRDKSLPPLPGESSVEFPYQARPQTVFTYDPQSLPSSALLPPQAGFRLPEARRQSFGGLSSSKPFSGSQTLPIKGVGIGLRGQPNVPPFLAEEKYGEFGVPRMSLGQWPGAQMSANSLQVPGDRPKKRKSKFGLSSLFGRKSSQSKEEPIPIVDPLDLSFRNSQDMRYMSMYVNENGYASPLSTSSHTPAPASVPPRMSIVSKKNLEDLVDQEPEFIAYRYPSNDQRLDLLR
ncbi:hypothetical protein BDW22DRAFT_222378 [Trametopsis cervina]|nr:hypothetical protein BDW22DRAFT_222378 [Trametopsis cervina]